MTTWGVRDFHAYFNQLARLRCNTFFLMSYNNDFEPLCGETAGVSEARPVMSSLSKPWQAVAALHTGQFAFGSGDCFGEEFYSSPAGQHGDDPLAQRKETVAIVREAMRLGRLCGIDVAAGLVDPVGDVNHPIDPTLPRERARFKARVRRFLENYPDLTYFALINHEAGGVIGTRAPTKGSARRLFEKCKGAFAHVGNSRRMWEAIRFLAFAEMAYEVLRQTAPKVRLVLSGWGGDRWMRFADYFPGYEQFLPTDVIFACSDNIDASVAPTVSEPWGQLPANRERWAIPWIEEDGSDFWTPQPNVESLRHLLPDALRKGCQGLLTMHWRTRDFEEEAGYAARFAWDSTLTPENFYRRMARDAFGADQEESMAQRLLTLQQLGRRWTGVMGTPEVGEMIFTGWKPHMPFELDGDAIKFLLPFTRKAAQVLAEPFREDDPFAGAEEVALLKQVHAESKADAGERGSNQLGVAEFQKVGRRLEGLVQETDAHRLRRELHGMIEAIYAVRTPLIQRGMPSSQFQAMDLFLIAAHHLFRNAGVRDKLATLRRIRGEVARLRDQYVAQGRTGRLERLDYLSATLDFSLHYDSVAMRLVADGRVDQALARAEVLRREGNLPGAAEIAAQAYSELLTAGMQTAVTALTRKLADRCALGVLATVNIKPVAKYMQFLDRLESFFPAVPPRELHASVHGEDVHLGWALSDAQRRARGFYVYRSEGGVTASRKLTSQPLPSRRCAFVDRPDRPGRYRYTVTTVDEKGWESPPSHYAEVPVGPEAPPPRLVAVTPPSILENGQPLEVSVAAFGSRAVTGVELHYRCAGLRRWKVRRMECGYRHSYRGTIPAERLQPGILEFFVAARDGEGRTAHWPWSALTRFPWTCSVLPGR